MEIGSLRAAAESTKHFADHKRPARKNPRARWPVFGRTGFKMTQGSSHSLSHWNRKGVAPSKIWTEIYVRYAVFRSINNNLVRLPKNINHNVVKCAKLTLRPKSCLPRKPRQTKYETFPIFLSTRFRTSTNP